MKKNMLALALSAATMSIACLVASPAWSAGQYGQAQNNQQRRIAQGANTGELTRHELNRLQHEQRHIKRFTHRVQADGRVDRWERRQLANKRQSASHHIYEAKHNRVAYTSCRPVSQRTNARRYDRLPRHETVNYGSFSGAIVQPGLAVGWNIGLR